MFTESPEGAGVMDGDGHIWRFHEGLWHSNTHPMSPVEPVLLAKGLCPDLAGYFEQIGMES